MTPQDDKALVESLRQRANWDEFDPTMQALLDGAADRTEALIEAQASAKARIEALTEALTASGDTKAAYMGEFSFNLVGINEDGDEHQTKIYVPWTTIKEIMAAILKRAENPNVG